MSAANILSDANLQFSLDVLRYASQNKANENFLCSPLSIFEALTVVAAGAKDSTVEEIKKALHLEKVDISSKAYNESIAKFVEVGELTDEIALVNANRLYLQKDRQSDAKFLEILKTIFKQDVEKIDFSDNLECCRVINTWIYENTNKRIQMMTGPESFQASMTLALMNASHLRASWFHRFDPEKTESKAFYVSSTETIYVPTMENLCDMDVGLFPKDNLKVLAMNLQHGDMLSMLIILPDNFYGLAEMESALTVDKLKYYISKLKSEIVKYEIPQFYINMDLDLKNVLQSMGVKKIFEQNGAELSGITGQDKVPISLALHKVRFGIDEEGIETLESSGIFSELACFIPQPVDFKIDHPFLVAIYDKRKKTIAHIGHITHPSL